MRGHSINYSQHTYRFYVVPVVGVSFLLNVTKFLEVRLRWETKNNETFPTYGQTDLRHDTDYVR